MTGKQPCQEEQVNKLSVLVYFAYYEAIIIFQLLEIIYGKDFMEY